MGTHPIFESDFDCLTEMRTEIYQFSGLKIYPGHGMRACKADGKVIRFLNAKSASLYHQKKNPRKLSWTLLYRRKHKKGISQETSIRRKTRRNVKAAKAVAGLSYNELLAKKQQKPEIRQKQRDAAVKAAKEKKKAADANKKAARAAAAKSGGVKGKNVTKNIQAGQKMKRTGAKR